MHIPVNRRYGNPASDPNAGSERNRAASWPGDAPYSRRYCGGGDLAACRASLWAALDAAAAQLEAAQGTDVSAWRADARRERITYGFLPATARFTNRPTFQQVMSFGGHRPRR